MLKNKFIQFFLLIILSIYGINNTSAFNYENFCKDDSYLRFVSKSIPLVNTEYKPKVLKNLEKIKEDRLKNKEDISFTVNESILLEETAFEHLDNLSKAFEKKFNKKLEIKEGYVSSSKNESLKKDGCLTNLCDGAGYSDNQLGLSVLLISGLNKKKFLENKEFSEYNSWLKTNAYKYGFINMYSAGVFIDGKEEVPGYYRYVGSNLSSFLEHSSMSFTEYIKENKKDVKCYKELDIKEEGNLVDIKTFRGAGFDSKKGVFPGTFRDYSIFDKTLLDNLRANLIVSESFLNLEHSMKNQNMTSFDEMYVDSIEYIKNYKGISDKERQKYLEWFTSETTRIFISDFLPGKILIESSGNTKINPGSNRQGVFQHYAMQFFSNGSRKCEGNSDYIYFSKCSKLKNIYKPGKVLTKEDKMEQLINIGLYAYNQYFLHNSIEKNLLNKNSKWSYYQNLKYIIQGLNKELKLSNEEMEKLTQDIIIKNSAGLTSFLAKKGNIMRAYGIEKPEDLYIWLVYIRVGGYGTLYNGTGNNGNILIRRGGDVKFVLDNNYISNSVTYGNCFKTITRDGGGRIGIKKQETLVMNHLQYHYKDYDIKQVEFSTLIKKLAKEGLLAAYVGKCN